MTAVRRVRLYEQISERLEGRIRDGEWAPGQELPSERDLMKEFTVGRPAVREALFELQRMGLIELRSGARARVATPDPKVVVTSLAGSARYLLSAPDGVRHFQEARTFFEIGLVREAARIAKPDDIRHLRNALEANRQSIGDLRRFEETDVAFHYAIVVIPRNPIYTALHAAIIEWLVEQRHTTLVYPGQNEVGARAHTAIYEAIVAQDADLAEQHMRDHLDQVAKLYWQLRGQA
jgi:GntR family transcriptional repressor for pyruvate dehydrogenase complex